MDVKISKITVNDLWDNEIIISSRFSPNSNMSPSGYRYVDYDDYESMGIYPYDPIDGYGCGCGFCYDYECNWECDHETGFAVPVYPVEVQREKMINKIFDLDFINLHNTLATYWPNHENSSSQK